MRVFRLRQVKKEIRALGLAAETSGINREVILIGVIFRGKKWLDGVIKTTITGVDITERTAFTIRESNHYPQIRVILIHRENLDGAYIDSNRLANESHRPVIALGYDEELPYAEPGVVSSITFREQNEEVIHAFGIDEKTAQRILSITSQEKELPEVLRVAKILRSAVNMVKT